MTATEEMLQLKIHSQISIVPAGETAEQVFHYCFRQRLLASEGTYESSERVEMTLDGHVLLLNGLAYMRTLSYWKRLPLSIQPRKFFQESEEPDTKEKKIPLSLKFFHTTKIIGREVAIFKDLVWQSDWTDLPVVTYDQAQKIEVAFDKAILKKGEVGGKILFLDISLK